MAKRVNISKKTDEEKTGIIKSGQGFIDIIAAYFLQTKKKTRTRL